MSQKTFAAALRRARETAGLSQKALAARIGMTGSYISQLESGARRPPRPKVVARICKALGIPERRLQDAAALERAPPPIRKRLERMARERGQVRRNRDRLLSTTLFHMARRPLVIDPMAAFVDLPPEQRLLLGRLVGRAREVQSVEEAERRSDDLLAETSAQERDLLARALPGVLAKASPGETAGAPAPAEAAQPAARDVPVYLDTTGESEPVDRVLLDARIGGESCYFLRVDSDEAHPRVEAGDLLLIDQGRKPRRGDTVVFREGGREHIRTYHRQGGRVRLDAARPDLPPLRLDETQVQLHVVILLVRALR